MTDRSLTRADVLAMDARWQTRLNAYKRAEAARELAQAAAELADIKRELDELDQQASDPAVTAPLPESQRYHGGLTRPGYDGNNRAEDNGVQELLQRLATEPHPNMTYDEYAAARPFLHRATPEKGLFS